MGGGGEQQNPMVSQQVIFQEDPTLWRLDMGLFSRQIHSNAARNKNGESLRDVNSLKERILFFSRQ